MNGEDIFFDSAITIDSIKINGNSFVSAKYNDSKYICYVDDNTLYTKITGLETATNIKLLAVPYVDHGEERTYLFDFDKFNYNSGTETFTGKGLWDILNINVVEGIYSITTTPEVTFKPINSQIIEVKVETDNLDSKLYMNVASGKNNLNVYSDENKNNLLSKQVVWDFKWELLCVWTQR